MVASSAWWRFEGRPPYTYMREKRKDIHITKRIGERNKKREINRKYITYFAAAV